MKELKIRYSTTVPNAYEFHYEGGGSIPADLVGTYTDHRNAEIALAKYREAQKAKKASK